MANREELDMLLNQKDTSKWPRYVVMNKKMRRIEQETRIQREDFDQLYEVTNKKKEVAKKGVDTNLLAKQEKLNRMNQEFEQLKNRQF